MVRVSLPIEIPARSAAAANLPPVLVDLALVLEDVPRNVRSAQLRYGTVTVTECPDCGVPLLPGFPSAGSWLENHLFAAEADDAPTLIAFFSDEIRVSIDRLRPGSRPLEALAVLAHPELHRSAYVDSAGRWLALAGWNYSGPHRHEKRNMPRRESYLTHDPGQGIRFASSTASAFAQLRGRPGAMLLAPLVSAGPPTSDLLA